MKDEDDDYGRYNNDPDGWTKFWLFLFYLFLFICFVLL
jgi:hypothetical protein